MKRILLISVLLLTTFLSFGQAYVAGSASDFEKYGLKPGNIPEKWEDGIQSDGIVGTYEWWYFDAHLEDGSKMVIVFYTKPFSQTNKGIIPYITVNIDQTDGTSIKKRYYGKLEEFSASKDSCNVIIGKNYFRGNLKDYQIHFEDDDLTIDVNLKRTTQSWRPKTGHFMYGTEGDYFAWVVPVPKGIADINYTYKGQSFHQKASAYHDHNFGNKNMAKLINHWYWSRAELGDYTVIAAELISDSKYQSVPVVVFNISKDGKTIDDHGEAVHLYRSYGVMENKGERPVSDHLRFVFNEGNVRYEYSLDQEKILVASKILDTMIKSKLKRKLAKWLTGFDGAYYRLAGTAGLKVFKDNVLLDNIKSEKAVWELMYFGKPYDLK